MAGHPRGTGRLQRDDRRAARVSAGMHVEKHLLEQKREGHVLEDEIPWGSRGEREKREADDAACATSHPPALVLCCVVCMWLRCSLSGLLRWFVGWVDPGHANR